MEPISTRKRVTAVKTTAAAAAVTKSIRAANDVAVLVARLLQQLPVKSAICDDFTLPPGETEEALD